MKKIYTLSLLLLVSTYAICEKTHPFASGSGTQADPYRIATAVQLDAIRGEYLDKWFLQISDIHLNVVPFNLSYGWKPIGGGDTQERFTGHYDGGGHIISGLRIYRAGQDNIGLFGHIGLPGSGSTSIRNVVLEDVNVSGGRGTGALVGRVTGNQNTRIENCHAISGAVEGDGDTGGLVGSNNSFMANAAAAESFRPVINMCSAGVTVRLRYNGAPGRDKFGGLVGCNQKGLISNSFSRGQVIAENATRVGGFAGCAELRGIIINCYATGKVTTTNSTQVGGFVGMVGVGRNEGTVSRCYWDIQSSEMATSAGGTGLTTAQMKESVSFTGWDFENIWKIVPAINDGYPAFVTTPAAPDVWTWKTGGTNNDWHVADNWDRTEAPRSHSIVVIPAGGNQPVVSQHTGIRDLQMQNGAQITIQNGYVLTVTGSLQTDTGNETIGGEGFLLLSGENRQSIPAIKVHNLKIDNLHNVRLEGDITVETQLEMINGLLDLNGFTLNLSPTANLREEELENTTTRIFGTSGYIKTQRNLNAPFGPIGGMGIEINSAADMGLTTIIRGHAELNGGDESKSILRYFDIKPANNSGLNATLKFYYFTSELNMSSEDEENNFSLFKRENESSEWIWVESTIDPENNWLVAHNLSGFSTWTAGSTTTPLPVSLLSFHAEVKHPQVEITWATATELNNDFFTLERSQDGVNFEVLAFVYGAGNSNQQINYKYIDSAPFKGVSYYRLKQTDFDGKFEYFRPVAVNVSGGNSAEIKVFPNPGNGVFYVELNSENPSAYSVYDMQGRLMVSDRFFAMTLNTLDLRSLQKGMYTLVIHEGEQKAIKLHVY